MHVTSYNRKAESFWEVFAQSLACQDKSKSEFFHLIGGHVWVVGNALPDSHKTGSDLLTQMKRKETNCTKKKSIVNTCLNCGVSVELYAI